MGFFEALDNYRQYLVALPTEYQEKLYLLVPFTVGSIVFTALVWMYLDITYENRMNKVKERRLIADIVCRAMSDAVLAKHITPAVRQRYERLLGVCLRLPDLIPKPSGKHLQARVVERLGGWKKATEKLLKMKRSAPGKRKEVTLRQKSEDI